MRGHRDDSTSENVNHGNCKALVDICVVSGDSVFDQHLQTGAKNVLYISKAAQNDLFTCMKEYMQEEILKDYVR